MSQKSYNNTASLYLIPTPIGNMDDITVRAVKILEMVDLLLCEDTRITDQLLKFLGIHKKLIPCHDHNEEKIKEMVVEQLKLGKNIGLVTDRGTPIISDPGYKIVEDVISQGYNVIGLPGPTALIPALITSGLQPAPFLFYGFLNAKESKRKKELLLLSKYPYTMIFYEAPHRIKETLKNILETMGNRKISLSREISKIYEEIYRGTVEEIIPLTDTMRGEMVLIVDGDHTVEDFKDISILEHIELYLDDGMSEKDAIKKVAVERGVPKSVIYKEYHVGK